MQKKSVLVLSDPYPGGEWFAVIRLLEALKKNGKFSYHLIGFKNTRADTEKYLGKDLFTVIKLINHTNSAKPLSFIKNLYLDFIKGREVIRENLNKHEFDIVFATGLLQTITVRLLDKNIKVIYLFHGIKYEIDNYDYRQIINRLLQKIALNMSSQIFVPSKKASEFISKNMPGINKKILIVPNIIPFYFFRKVAASEKTIFRKKYAIGIKSKIVLYSGRIERYKGLQNLINGFLMTKKDDKVLVIAYPQSSVNSNLLEGLKKTSAGNSKANKILFLPDLNTHELVVLYSTTSLLVLPSEIEMAPLSLIEGFAQGLPAIATKTGNSEELLSLIDKRLLLIGNTPHEISSKLNWFFGLRESEVSIIKKRASGVAGKFTEDAAVKSLSDLRLF